LKLFTNAAAAAPEWAAGIAIKTAIRDMQGATADVGYTGIGFKPSTIIAFASPGNNLAGVSWGFSNGTTEYCIGDINLDVAGAYYSRYALIFITNAAASAQGAVVKTLDVDGFTLTWTYSPTSAAGTATLFFLCFR